MMRAFLVLALVSLALAAVPAASAIPTTLEVRSETPSDPVRPLSGVTVVKGRVIYGYVGPAAPTTLAPTKVTLSATGPAWATVSVSPATLHLALSKSDTPVVEEEFFLLITALADAPAFTMDKVTVTATAAPNGQLEASNGAVDVSFQAAYYGIVDARVEQPIRMATPQKAIEFPVTVKNFGNGQTKVTFELQNLTGGLTAPAPQPMTLDSRATGGTMFEATRVVTVQTPFANGYVNVPGMVQLKITSAYSHDPSKRGDEMVMSLILNTRGFYAPGPEPLLLVAGALALALVARPALARRER